MTEFITQFTQKAHDIRAKHLNYVTIIGGGISGTEMLRRMERMSELTPVVEKELLDMANSLIEQNNVAVTDELRQQMQNIANDVMAYIIKANTTGFE